MVLTAAFALSNFYPRSPCGERPTRRVRHRSGQNISIHALLAESDSVRCAGRAVLGVFLSTLSLRRATNDAINGCNPDFISIHALLAESDVLHIPAGYTGRKFLSTLSLRRATL